MYPLLNSAAKVVQNFDMAKKKSVINYFEHEKFTRYHWREAPVPALTVDSRGVPDPTPCHIERRFPTCGRLPVAFRDDRREGKG